MGALTVIEVDQISTGWLELIHDLLDEVAGWSEEEGWVVTWESLDRATLPSGAPDVPMLILQPEKRAVFAEPVPRDVLGALGRVDLYAYPTLYRVMLLRSPQTTEWRIRTDSGIFLDKPWNKETFVRLVNDLTAAG